MTSPGIVSQLADISRYMKGLREQKLASEDAVNVLQSERDGLVRQIELLQSKLEVTDRNLAAEKETVTRLQQSLDRADATYEKLVESSRCLVDFVKKEYYDAKRPNSNDSN